MGRYLTVLGRSFLVAAFAVFAVGLTASSALAQTAPSVVVFLDNGMLATAFDPICAQYAQLPPLANCTQSATSLTNISGDSSSCLQQPAGGHQLNFSITDPQIAAALAAALAPYFQVTGLVNFLVFAVYPVTNSCTAPIYLSVHANGQWNSLAPFGAIGPGAATDVIAGLLFVSSPAGLLPDGVLACSSPPAQGASACPTGAPVAPSGCTLTANPSQLPAGGGSVTLTTACSAGDPPTTYTWTGPNVAPTTTGASQKVNVTATSTFTVIASNGAGAAPAASATVTVSSLTVPVCTLSANPPQLPVGGGTVTLTTLCNPAATSFGWSGPNVNPSTSTPTQQVSVTATSTFSVVGANASGSSAPAFATVSVVAGKTYVFTTIDYPGAVLTDIRGINNVGQIAGYTSLSQNGPNFGFVYQSGAFTPLPAPSPVPGNGAFPNTSIIAINDLGVMTGGVSDVNGKTGTGVIAIQDEAFATSNGFALGGAAYAYFSHPGYNFTEGRAIGDSGLVTGWANNNFVESSPGLTTGFIYDPVAGTFTDIFVPSSYFTLAQGINAGGQVVGNVYLATVPHATSFLRQPDGTMTMFTVNGGETQARGINDSGLITGFVDISGQPTQTFVGNSTTGYQLIALPGAAKTDGEGINNAGQIVGPWVDAAGNFHGFLATPIATPSSTTSSGAYIYSEQVSSNVPIFVAPTVASGFAFTTGASDPMLASVRLPVGASTAQFTLTVADQTFGIYAGDLFDFRAHGFPNGVGAFSITGIDTSVFSGAANARALPIELDFVGSGTFTGTQTPLGP